MRTSAMVPLLSRSGLVRTMVFMLAGLWMAAAARGEFLVPDQQYRCQPGQADCKKPWFQQMQTPVGKNPYSINFVEYDDKGKPWEPRELQDALTQIHNARGTAGDQGVLVMLYIHGWQNNADERPGGCGDVCQFRDHLLPKLADQYSAANGTPLKVVGVYLAWRGLTFTVEPFKHIVSYWPRRSVARTVGRKGMFDALAKIEETVGEKRENYVVVFAGHSFGARVLENAVELNEPGRKGLMLQYRDSVKQFASMQKQALLSGREFQARMNKNLPVDLVVYVNAATASTVTRRTIRDMRETCKQAKAPICGADPVYMAFTSRGDVPTGIIMPIANLLFPAFRSDGFHIFSAADTPSLHTHTDPAPSCHGDPALCFDVKAGNPPVQESIYRIDKRGEMPDGKTNPFWIFNVNRAVSANHGDVWNDAVISLVANAIAQTPRVSALKSGRATMGR